VRITLALLFIVAFSVSSLSAQSVESRLDALVAGYAAEDDPALVVLVTTPDGRWSSVSGFADETRSASPEDRFRIGSMSKTFVAAAALILVDEGVFALDDKAREWLPDDVLENIANADDVTLRQLLAMRSGIPDYLENEAFWDAVLDEPAHPWTAGEVLEYAYGMSAMFTPDEDFAYSNTNYILIQLILEAATGSPLHDILRTRILEPLALDDTYTQISEELPGAFVHGYGDLDGDGSLEDLTDINDGAGLGDGGLVSNAADLTAFYQALFVERRLLSEATLQALLRFQSDDESRGYSLGLSEWDTPAGIAWGHAGGVLGFLSIGAYIPDTETTIIVLSASEHVAPDEVALAALELLAE
jgi:D-alanyl-D-alanine carboxypeptidase